MLIFMEITKTATRTYKQGMIAYKIDIIGQSIDAYPVYQNETDSGPVFAAVTQGITGYIDGFLSIDDGGTLEFFGYTKFSFDIHGNIVFSDVPEFNEEVHEVLEGLIKALTEKYDISIVEADPDIDTSPAHRTHCCEIHGCKYGPSQVCPVARQVWVQAYLCERCENPKDMQEEIDYLTEAREKIIALTKKIEAQNKN